MEELKAGDLFIFINKDYPKFYKQVFRCENVTEDSIQAKSISVFSLEYSKDYTFNFLIKNVKYINDIDSTIKNLEILERRLENEE